LPGTPTSFGEPRITDDETLEPFDVHNVQRGDVVAIGIHTGNARVRDRYAREGPSSKVIFGGIQATLYPTAAETLGGAHAVVKGDGDVAWQLVPDDATHAGAQILDACVPSAAQR
jgi:radical SAM superfamily enzyme YgiQ (UPF0313 family)